MEMRARLTAAASAGGGEVCLLEQGGSVSSLQLRLVEQSRERNRVFSGAGDVGAVLEE